VPFTKYGIIICEKIICPARLTELAGQYLYGVKRWRRYTISELVLFMRS
jgi:hypothetical protein